MDEDAGSTHCFSAPGKGRSWGTPCLMITCRGARTHYKHRAGKRFSRRTVHASDDVRPHGATAILGNTHQASSRHAPRSAWEKTTAFKFCRITHPMSPVELKGPACLAWLICYKLQSKVGQHFTG